MTNLEEEISQLKTYFKHHRIVTYASITFMVLLSVVSIASFRALNPETAYNTSSQAAGNGNNRTDCATVVRTYNQRGPDCWGCASIKCGFGSPYSNTPTFTRCASEWGNACYSRAGWQTKANEICKCPYPTATPTPTPTATPTPTPTPIPTEIPNCGDKCLLDDSGQSTLGLPVLVPCRGGSVCRPCKNGENCAGGTGRCGGSVCEPTPTPPVSCEPAAGDCREVFACKPGNNQGCMQNETCTSTSCTDGSRRYYCCGGIPFPPNSVNPNGVNQGGNEESGSGVSTSGSGYAQ